MAITCLSILLGNLDKILLSRLLPLEIYGYYAFAVVVAQAPLGFVAPIAQAYYPRFTQLHSQDNQAGLAIAYHSATQLVTVLLGAASAFLILFGREVLEIWTNNAALSERTYSLAAVLSAGTLFNGLVTVPYFLQLSSGWTTLTLRVNLFAVVLVAPALLILVPQFGAMAAAWVWLALNTFYVIVVIPIMHRRLLPREKWRWYIQDVTSPLITAFVIGSLLRLIFPTATGRFQNLAVLIFCALLLTLSAAFAAPIVRKQMLRLFSRSGINGR
jgi:O-antigen/teichoic acid export membrane protein